MAKSAIKHFVIATLLAALVSQSGCAATVEDAPPVEETEKAAALPMIIFAVVATQTLYWIYVTGLLDGMRRLGFGVRHRNDRFEITSIPLRYHDITHNRLKQEWLIYKVKQHLIQKYGQQAADVRIELQFPSTG